MTQEEARVLLKNLNNQLTTAFYDGDFWVEEGTFEAFEVADAALRGPQPDPDTGLVPCGCGGTLKPERFNDGFFDLERIACECGIEITSGPGFCKPAWNRAMGWKAEG